MYMLFLVFILFLLVSLPSLLFILFVCSINWAIILDKKKFHLKRKKVNILLCVNWHWPDLRFFKVERWSLKVSHSIFGKFIINVIHVSYMLNLVWLKRILTEPRCYQLCQAWFTHTFIYRSLQASPIISFWLPSMQWLHDTFYGLHNKREQSICHPVKCPPWGLRQSCVQNVVMTFDIAEKATVYWGKILMARNGNGQHSVLCYFYVNYVSGFNNWIEPSAIIGKRIIVG